MSGSTIKGVVLTPTGETLVTPSPAEFPFLSPHSAIFVVFHSPAVLSASAHPRADHVCRHIGCLIRERGREISSSKAARTIGDEVG
ncbi:hypothetical protein CVT25_001873 [Psilocybe cyanescens]|uniref:Uncharacterized protein n=1 Tax=Psilocybe cyanescens TaxID=93625 RepID=A0A409W9T1_PSICY|nr:hypothetical protein CVT25_001873 [Psilocybe cyanescens]